MGAVIDSGANVSCIDPRAWDWLRERRAGIGMANRSTPVTAAGDNATTMQASTTPIQLSMGGRILHVPLVIMTLPWPRVLLGMDVLQRVGAVIDCSVEPRRVWMPGGAEIPELSGELYGEASGTLLTLTLHSHLLDTTLQQCTTDQQFATEDQTVEQAGPAVSMEGGGESMRTFENLATSLGEQHQSEPPWSLGDNGRAEQGVEEMVEKSVSQLASPEDQATARAQLWEFRDVFSKDVALQPMDATPFEIHTVHEAPAGVRYHPRHTTEQLQFLDKEIQRLYALGIIVESASMYNNPVLLVKKDFRQLNAVTRPMAMQIPLMEDIFDAAAGYRMVSRMDLTSAYFQLAMHPNSQHKTAFTCHLGTYEYTRAALGMKNVPAAFNFLLQGIFIQCRQYLKQYFDDLLAFSKSFQEHCTTCAPSSQSVGRDTFFYRM